MGWAEQHGLQSRLASLPPLLAGPVLRQVTANAVTVWVALKRSYNVKLDILGSDSDFETPIMSGSLRTTALGTNLHIAAVTARSTTVFDALSEGKIYFYNLTLTPGGPPPVQLTFSDALTPEAGSPGSVPVESVLGCGSYSLPSFALPPTELASLKLLHGSCRKPHAEGRDALAIVDTLIQQHWSSPLERPHQLLLTGDQIYADDVADGLLLMLSDAGETLLGWSETVDLGGGVSPLRFADWPSYYREGILEAAGFTSEDLKSHLMSLGDFLSMYLFVWSDVLWPLTLPAFADVNDAVAQPGVKGGLGQPWVDEITAFLEGKKKTIEEELRYVALLTATLPNVRRALANIPTYMMCDDHEVTDDWNMTRRFCDEVYGRPIGRRVVQNALIAFALCQAWGNNPDRFSTNPITAGATLLLNLANVSNAPAASRAAVYETSGSAFQSLLGIHPATVVLPRGRVFHDPETNLPQNAENKISLRFDFHVEGPGHLILVSDTRTWRAYPQKGIDTPADFLPTTSTPPQLTSQLSTDPSHLLGDRILIVVLTTNAPPIASVRYAAAHPLLIDTGQHKARVIKAVYEAVVGSSEAGMPKELTGERRAIYKNDLYDSWELPGDRFDRLITQIDSLAQTGSRKQVLLLSGDVHSSFASRFTLFDADPDDRLMGTPRLVIGQLVSSPFKNQSKDTRGQQIEGYTWAPKEIARHLVPDHVPEFFKGPRGQSVYRLDYLVADSEQPPPGGFPEELTVLPDEDVANLRNYDSMDTFDRGILLTGASPLQIIGHNNIAELTFVSANAAEHTFASANARHALHWYGPSGPPYTTRYTVSLDLEDPEYQMPFHVGP